MALPIFLKQLKENEKKIHVIWIDKLPEGEFDNLKIWTYINQNYEINIWIDSEHILVPLLKKNIEKNQEFH